MHCKACDAPMQHVELEDHPGNYEFLCDHCKRKGADATSHDQYYFEGLWWDMHWTGKDHYDARQEVEHEQAKAERQRNTASQS